jgi:hypothetical protein
MRKNFRIDFTNKTKKTGEKTKTKIETWTVKPTKNEWNTKNAKRQHRFLFLYF